eukprot:SM000001S04493  [mRNA]  locus=s1:564431:566154:- [translate_table: standard]
MQKIWGSPAAANNRNSNPSAGPYQRGIRDELPPPVVYEERRSRNCFKSWCCCLLAIVVALVVAIVIAGLIIWLIFKPKDPDFQIDDVKVLNASVTTGATSNGIPTFLLNGATNVTVIAHNPNKFTIKYENVTVLISYKDNFIGKTRLPVFKQKGHATDNVYADFVFSNVDVVDVGADLLADITKRRVTFFVKAFVIARAEYSSLRSPHVRVHLGCNVTVDPVTSDLESKSCASKIKGIDF